MSRPPDAAKPRGRASPSRGPAVPVCNFGIPCFVAVRGKGCLKDCELTVDERRPKHFHVLTSSPVQDLAGGDRSSSPFGSDPLEAETAEVVEKGCRGAKEIDAKAATTLLDSATRNTASDTAHVNGRAKDANLHSTPVARPPPPQTPGTRPPPLRPKSEPHGASSAVTERRSERRRRRRQSSSADSSTSTPGSAAARCFLPPTNTLLHTPSCGGPSQPGSRKSRSFKEDLALTGAIREGRWVEAHRRWQSLEASATAHLFDPAKLARLQRISARFSESEAELTPAEGEANVQRHGEALKRGDMVEALRDGHWHPALIRSSLDHPSEYLVSWSDGKGLDPKSRDEIRQEGSAFFRLSNNSLQVTSSKVFRGIDALHAFVGLCEYDLLAQHMPELLAATPLDRSFEGDGLWHVLKKGVGGKEDNILQLSCLDALEEPLGALWVSTYVPWELEDADVGVSGVSRRPSDHHWAELRGTTLPLHQQGAVRLDYWRSVCAIRPIWPESPSSQEPAFHITIGIRRRPSSAACVFPAYMQREVDAFWTSFRAYLQNCRDLSWRMCFSPNAGLYDSIRRRLAERAPAGVRGGCALQRMRFADLSAHLPEDWADACE